MKQIIFLLHVSLMINCSAMEQSLKHPALSQKVYEEYADKLLKNLQGFSWYPSQHKTVIEKHLKLILEEISSNDADKQAHAGNMIDFNQVDWFTKEHRESLPELAIIREFAENMKLVWTEALCTSLAIIDGQRNTREEYKDLKPEKFNQICKQHYTDEIQINAQFAEAQKYAETILAVMNKK